MSTSVGYDAEFDDNLTLFFPAPDNGLSIKTLGLDFFQHLDNYFVIVILNLEDHGGSVRYPKN